VLQQTMVKVKYHTRALIDLFRFALNYDRLSGIAIVADRLGYELAARLSRRANPLLTHT